MKPDIHGMAIEIAAKKGFKPPKGEDEGPEAEPLSPHVLDAASDICGVLGCPPEKTEQLANALAGFLDAYNGGDDSESEPEAEAPSGPPEE
jgi:hypothetical protein